MASNETAFKTRLLNIAEKLHEHEIESIAWLVNENYSNLHGDAQSIALDLLQALKHHKRITAKDSSFLKHLLKVIRREDLAQLVPEPEGASAAAEDVCEFRVLLYHISQELTQTEVKKLSFLSDMPPGQSAKTAISFCVDQMRKCANDYFAVARGLIQMLESIMRNDLADRIRQHFMSTGAVSDDLALSFEKRVSLGKGPPISSRLVSRFSARTLDDKENPRLDEVLLLPGGLVLVTDRNNSKVKLFERQGKLVAERKTKGILCRLTRHSGSKVYILDKNSQTLELLDISHQGMKTEATHHLSKKYWYFTKLNENNLAATVAEIEPEDDKWWPSKAIDILDPTGKVVRTLKTNGKVRFLCCSRDNFIVYTDWYKIYKMNTSNGVEVFAVQVPEISDPHGVAETLDGSLLICDCFKASLALCSKECKFLKELFTKPKEEGVEDKILYVSICDNLCVCANHTNLYVLELIY